MSENNKKNNEEDVILIAKMYTGRYIENEVGHEIINFFKPDEEENNCYGYIIDTGKIDSNRYKNIKTILLVSSINNKKVRIIAKIEKPEFISSNKDYGDKEGQDKFIEINKIKYGGKLLNGIMGDKYGIYITYRVEAKKIKEPKETMYILLKDSAEKVEEYNNIKMKEKSLGHTKTYISSKDHIVDYNEIMGIISDEKLWKEKKIKKIEDISKEDKDKYRSLGDNETSFMDIIKREADEELYSNMLKYYLEEKKMFKGFAQDPKVLNIDNIGDDAKIEREKFVSYKPDKTKKPERGRIDLFIEDEKNGTCIVIENKIESGIHGEDYDNNKKSQLEVYVDWVYNYKENEKKNAEKDKNEEQDKKEKLEKYKEYNKYFFIFSPTDRQEELEKEINIINGNLEKITGKKDTYRLITYEKIYNYFKAQEENFKREHNDRDNIYYEDSLKALSKHIFPADKEMERKFVNAIDKVKE